MALFVFFLLQLTCHLLRIQPLSDQRIVFFIVFVGPLGQDLYLCRLLLLVTDAYHEVIKLYYGQSNICVCIPTSRIYQRKYKMGGYLLPKGDITLLRHQDFLIQPKLALCFTAPKLYS